MMRKILFLCSLLIAILSFAGCSNVSDESALTDHLDITVEDASQSKVTASPSLNDIPNHNNSETVSESTTPSVTDPPIQSDAARENDKPETVPTSTPQPDITEENTIIKMNEAATLCFRNPIDNQEVENIMEELITGENQFIITLNTTWPPETAEQIEHDGMPYLLVGEISWTEYENVAKNYYSDDYVTNVFTPQYLTGAKTFIELDGKLYRAMSDGIGMPVMKDSVSMWKVSEGLYYVTVLLDSFDITPVIRVYIIKENPDKMYGYEILDKYNPLLRSD